MKRRGKTGGRTKGTPNKITKTVRGKFEQIINSFEAESLILDLKSVEPLERLKMIVTISEVGKRFLVLILELISVTMKYTVSILKNSIRANLQSDI